MIFAFYLVKLSSIFEEKSIAVIEVSFIIFVAARCNTFLKHLLSFIAYL
jgi:hypothetical protein